MTKEEEVKLGQELDRTNSMLKLRISKSECYTVIPVFNQISTDNIVEAEGIAINHWYIEDRHLEHLIYNSTLNDHPEVLRDFEAAIETDKYEIRREYVTYHHSKN